MKLNWQKGLIPAIIQHYQNGTVLMLGYMNEEAFNLTQETNFVHFFSRSKNRIWKKGETSNNTLEVISINIDCDNDTILIQAKPSGVICHTGSMTCFGNNYHSFFNALEDIIHQRIHNYNNESYVNKLVNLGINRVAQKIGEEATEVIIAALNEEHKLLDEASDLIFHLIILLQMKNITLKDISNNLEMRHQQK